MDSLRNKTNCFFSPSVRQDFFLLSGFAYNWIFLSIFSAFHSFKSLTRCVINWSFHIIIIKSKRNAKQMAQWEYLANVLMGIIA